MKIVLFALFFLLDFSEPTLAAEIRRAEGEIGISCPSQGRLAKSIVLAPHRGELVRFRIGKNAPQWIEFEQLGSAISLDLADGRQRIDVPVPLRFGWIFVTSAKDDLLVAHRADQGNTDGVVRVTAHCEVTVHLAAKLDWFRKASRLALEIKGGQEYTALEKLLAALNSLGNDAPDATMRALAQHMFAQALLVNDQAAAAATAFAVAENAWNVAGQPPRALVARVGRIEDLQRTGNLTAVLALAKLGFGGAGANSYFSTRLENAACVARASLGLTDQAARCYRKVIRAAERLDEQGQRMTSLRAYASLQVDRGRLDSAEALGQKVATESSGPDAPRIRGQARYMLAGISLQRGEISEAIERLNASLDDFAAAGATRWQANVMLVLAQLYAGIGAFGEAYAFLSEAVRHLSPRDAPARIAASLLTLSDIERDMYRPQSALVWASAAMQLFEKLDMPVDVEGARIARLQLKMQLSATDAVARELSSNGRQSPLYSNQWKLLKAELALVQRRPVEARALLDGLEGESISLRDQLRLVEMEAAYWSAIGKPDRAEQELFSVASAATNELSSTSNPILRHVMQLRLAGLRREGLKIGLLRDDARELYAVSEAWKWISLGALREMSVRSRSLRFAERFDRAVSSEFFSDAVPKPLDVHRQLLSVLATRDKELAMPMFDASSLSAWQRARDPGDMFVAYLDAGDTGKLLVVTQSSAHILKTLAPSELRVLGSSMGSLLKSPESTPGQVEAATIALSERLLAALRGREIPQRLLIMSDDMIDALPWPLLRWPGSDQVLNETTAISLVRLDRQKKKQAKGPNPVHVIIAARAQSSNSAYFPELDAANAEPAAIRSVLEEHRFDTADGSKATPAGFMAALQQPHSWVHVGAHGVMRFDRMGYAGVWLNSETADGPPQFVSWLDVLGSGVRADLVVMNACQLGDSGEAINGNLSFAIALSQAGAANVVAAMWPVSDAASAVWVPAFYSALTADPKHDAAQAVRAAQLKLRNSRMFRHPFYWAGLQTFTRIPVGAAASTGSVGRSVH